MWKKIALFQLLLLVALAAFWIGKETHAIEPVRRELTTSNEDGDKVYIWSYNSGEKEWEIAALDYQKGTYQEKNISTRIPLR